MDEPCSRRLGRDSWKPYLANAPLFVAIIANGAGHRDRSRPGQGIPADS
jgi:hypothetical protein